jgi:hypothetical protein
MSSLVSFESLFDAVWTSDMVKDHSTMGLIPIKTCGPKLQLNFHETDLLFHHLTWHCSSIYEDLHRFAAYEHKIVQKQ